MATIHVYIAFQDLNLTAQQRGRVWNAIQAFYESVQVPTDQPHEIFWPMRRSIDNRFAIGEALFDDTRLSVDTFKQFLADEFGIDPSTIVDTRNDTTISQRVSPFWTFSRLGTNYFRAGVFGGLGATRAQSLIEVLAYVDANRANWDNPAP